MEYQKVKSVAKNVLAKGDKLDGLILNTMQTISSVVGATLGPGGQPVLIERFEHDAPVTITKDGVTVFRALGFPDPVQHCIMEAARDAAIHTASEAGDGTTTATVLSEAIVRHTHAYCKKNPRVSPQKVVRHLERVFKEVIEPKIRECSILADFSSIEGRRMLHSVAKISANGDIELADAVLRCFDICGDEGNVTITDVIGPSRYEVEMIKGYPIAMGYEESCSKFYPKFINDVGSQKCMLENPIFIPYHGRINETQKIIRIMERIAKMWDEDEAAPKNVVIAATGFSDSVLADLALNFPFEHTINVFPLLVPQSPMPNGQLHFLEDLCAITNSNLFDPISKRLEEVDDLEEFGNISFNTEKGKWESCGVSLFECGRYRCSIIGHANEDALLSRVDDLKRMALTPESELDGMILKERIAKVSGGIAKLVVMGSSNGELKEKRDRADDAVCAVRGAIKHGCLFGGGWMLIKIIQALPQDDVTLEVLEPALMEPFKRLLSNSGIHADEAAGILSSVIDGIDTGNPVVYNCLEDKLVNPMEEGILDSTPAVLEAIRNSISIASLLGTLGGTVVFARDEALERSESRETQQFLRDSNEANLRA